MTTALTKLPGRALEKLNNARARLARLRENSAKKGEEVLGAVEVVGGGAAAAIVDHYFAKPFVDNIGNSAVVGAVGVVGGMAELFGNASEHFLQIGAGMLAVEANKRVATALAK